MAKRPGRKRKMKKPTLAKVTFVEVENPLWMRDHDGASANPKKIQAAFNMRESYVGFLWQRKHIDDAQKMAADRIRHSYEKMGGAGAKAIDYSKVRVDGGGKIEDVRDEHLIAAAYLRESFRCLGPEGHDLVVKFCAEGRWPADFQHSKKLSKPLPLLSQCLTALAEQWGWKTRTIRSYRVA